MSDERLCRIYLQALAEVYDPHSAYLSPAEVRMFQTGLVKHYTLGITLRANEGLFQIMSLHPALGRAAMRSQLLGCSLLAIRAKDGSVCDVVEMHPDDFHQLIRSPLGPLQSDTQVYLELLNPVTHQRKTIVWNRLATSELRGWRH